MCNFWGFSNIDLGIMKKLLKSIMKKLLEILLKIFNEELAEDFNEELYEEMNYGFNILKVFTAKYEIKITKQFYKLFLFYKISIVFTKFYKISIVFTKYYILMVHLNSLQ